MMDGQLALAVSLDDHARFETYLPGPNAEVVAHLLDLVQNPGNHPATWLRGPRGSGKSHLLQAACAAAMEAGARAQFVPLGGLAHLQPAVLQDLAGHALLCLDDIDAIAGQMAWEEAAFDAFNEIRAAGGALLVSAGPGPRDAGFALPDLGSRLSWGPTYRLQALSDEERISALRLRARRRGFELPREVGEWLLRRVPRDMNSLYRLLDRLDSASLAAGRRLTIPFVRDILSRRDEST